MNSFDNLVRIQIQKCPGDGRTGRWRGKFTSLHTSVARGDSERVAGFTIMGMSLAVLHSQKSMLTILIYSLVGLALVMFLGRDLSRTVRLLLSLITLVLLNGPTLLTLLFHA